MSLPSLISTERRLVTLFVGGAFLFLVIFETIFLFSRIILEEQYTEGAFLDGISRVERRNQIHDRSPWLGDQTGQIQPSRTPLGIGYLTLEPDGQISGGQFGPELMTEEVVASVNSGFLTSLPEGMVVSQDGLTYYKKNRENGGFRIFIQKAAYPIDDIFRDIFRFFVLDILIVIPFYFMGRLFVREVLEPVEENLDTMNYFIHDAGHELKTPLAIVSGNLQLLRDLKKPDPHIIDETLSTIQGMTGSIDGLLELANIDTLPSHSTLNIEKAIGDEIAVYQNLLDRRKITLEKTIKKGMKFSIDPKHFSLLFGNLLKNAITYNKDGGSIRIIADAKFLSITDTGIGIDEKHLSKIWERFYRVDRSGKISGNGIGLSLVDRIVRLYGWKIEVQSEKNIGTTFLIRGK